MKTYKANRKGPINYLLIGFVILTCIFFFLKKESLEEKPFTSMLLLSPIALLLWIYLDTFYKIENQKLKYKSGFLRGEVDISEIREIIKGKTMWSGIKPALAKNGLIIKFNRFDEIYIAPESNDEVIIDLLKINQKINITE